MIAYDETYVSGAQRRMGALCDFATNGIGFQLDQFYQLFLMHPLSKRFAAGDPAVVAGRSGEELVLEVVDQRSLNVPNRWVQHQSASPEYWTGWALAFYQWASGYTFSQIERRVCIKDVRSLYSPYHEMDIRQFCDKMDELCSKSHPQTNLQAYRLDAGFSQSQLARAAHIPVRTLQQYEQRQKRINRARVDYVESLARVLGCRASDLLERSAREGYEYAFITLGEQ